MKDVIDTTAANSCACANLRRTDLVVTQFYDGMLAPSGLYAIQFGLLATLNKLAPITINYLAEVMDMDRGSLMRQVKILMDEDLVCSQEDPEGRTQLLLTREGEQTLQRAWPLWQEAQACFEKAFGHERFEALLRELSTIRTALNSGVS